MHSIWQVDGNPGYKTETIIPKGIVEIIFNFSEQDVILAQLGKRQYLLPQCFISGFATSPVHLVLPGQHFFFGVRFHPAAIRHVFGVPAGEFANHSVDLTLIDHSIHSLWHQLIEEKTFAGRVSTVTAWLLKKNYDISGREKLMNHFLSDLNQQVPSPAELSGILSFSPRHLSRKLKDLTGMNLEESLLYKKYLHSVNLIHHTHLSLTEIAYACQFADQSHFIKTFRSLAQMTPGGYKNAKSPLAGHIYRDVR